MLHSICMHCINPYSEVFVIFVLRLSSSSSSTNFMATQVSNKTLGPQAGYIPKLAPWYFRIERRCQINTFMQFGPSSTNVSWLT